MRFLGTLFYAPQSNEQFTDIHKYFCSVIQSLKIYNVSDCLKLIGRKKSSATTFLENKLLCQTNIMGHPVIGNPGEQIACFLLSYVQLW